MSCRRIEVTVDTRRPRWPMFVLAIVAGDAIGNCISFTLYPWIHVWFPWLTP